MDLYERIGSISGIDQSLIEEVKSYTPTEQAQLLINTELLLEENCALHRRIQQLESEVENLKELARQLIGISTAPQVW